LKQAAARLNRRATHHVNLSLAADNICWVQTLPTIAVHADLLQRVVVIG
jgi:hypothetical protein